MLARVLLALLLPINLFAAQARSLPPDVMKAHIAEPHFTRESAQFTIPNGPTINGKIMVPGPRRLSELDQKLPVLLVFGGFEEADKVLDLLDPKVPVIVASFDYPFEPARRFDFPESLRDAPAAKLAIQNTVCGIGEFVKVLKKRRDVDPERITIVGASFGAPFALAAAAEDPELSGVVLIHAFGKISQALKAVITRKWKPYLGFFAQPFAWLISNAGLLYLNPPEPEASARRLNPNQHVLMISADSDSTIPSESVESLWNALKVSKAHRERINMPGDHLKPGADKLISEIQGIVTSWMEKSDLR